MHFFNVSKVNKLELFVNLIFAVNDFLIIGYILESSKRNFSELTRCIDRGHEYLHSRNADSKILTNLFYC